MRPAFLNTAKMNLTNVKTEKERVEIFDGVSLDIQNYGLRNDYPQRLKMLTAASVTAKGCLQTYAKFMQGSGFEDPNFYQAVINDRQEQVDQLLNRTVKDVADFRGFAWHFNYNAMAEIVEVNFVHFEHCRLTIEDDNGRVGKIALHRDWTKKRRTTRISKQTIDYIDVFNPRRDVVLAQMVAAGGPENYKGQILYYNLDGDMVYPVPIYDAAITDISTEAGVSNVMYRNTRMNFMPAGMLIRQLEEPDPKKEEGRSKDTSFTENFKAYQGDENACKIIDVEVDADEVKPEFVPFELKAKGPEMELTSRMVSEKIGKPFLQPPILRAESVATGFTLQAMRDAYDFYNSITQPERVELERVFQTVFSKFAQPVNPGGNYAIKPLSYGNAAAAV